MHSLLRGHCPAGCQGSWEVNYCEHCNFSWRTTEETDVIIPEKRPAFFQLKGVDLGKLMHPCPIPPLKTGV